MKSIILPPRTGVDFDGVLCECPSTMLLIKDLNEYKKALENLPLKYNFKNPYVIATGRTYLVRNVSKQWLKKHNILFRHLLCMKRPFLPMPFSKTIALHKVKAIKEYELKLFIDDEIEVVKLIKQYLGTSSSCKVVTLGEFFSKAKNILG